MQFLEAYLYLGSDVFLSNLIILPLKSEMVLTAMLIFGGYEKYLIIIIATLAASLANLGNLYMGKFAALCFRYEENNLKPNIKKITQNIKQHSFWLVFFSFIPLVGIPLIVLYGFIEQRFKFVFLVSLMGHFFYYISMIVFHLY